MEISIAIVLAAFIIGFALKGSAGDIADAIRSNKAPETELKKIDKDNMSVLLPHDERKGNFDKRGQK